MSIERRRQMIEPGHPALSVVRQCELVSISRSGFYYQPVGETELTLALMRLIDAQFLETPPQPFHPLCGRNLGLLRPGMARGRWRAISGARATK